LGARVGIEEVTVREVDYDTVEGLETNNEDATLGESLIRAEHA
jgi:hypothetical protein